MIKNPANSPPQPTTLLAWMDSLADETRLRLLHLLDKQELGVVELRDILQLPQSTVSRHLKVLADQGWLRSRRLATNHLYRMILDELDPTARKLWLLARSETGNWATLQQDELRLVRRLREREAVGSAEFFAGAAAEWDKLRGELYGQSCSTAALLALLPRAIVVADLGCGTGELIDQLAPHVRSVIGIDNSPAMLKAARKRLAKFDNVELRRGDLQSLPIDDASVDAAMMLLALTYVPAGDLERVMHELSRITKPGGRAVVVDLLPHDRDDFRRQLGQLHAGFSEQQIRRLLTDAGFPPASITIIRLPPEPTAKGPALFLATATKN